MKLRTKTDTDHSWLLRNGIHIYPVYDRLRNRWYIEVLNTQRKNKPKRYEKPIGIGKVLNKKSFLGPIEATAKHWCKILNKVENE